MKADFLKGPAGYALVILAGGAVLWMLWNKLGDTARAAAQGAGGLATGNNAITGAARTDAYKGAGVVGTVGAAIDNTSGGIFSRVGEGLGGWLYDVTHPDNYNPSTGLQTATKTVAEGALATDSLWGKIGSVSLRQH